MSAIAEFTERLLALPEDARRDAARQVLDMTKGKRWFPNPGPQTEAYFSRADILLYGGQAGGGKTDLMVGLSSQEHQRSIIFRRESSQTDGIEAAGKRIIADSARFNGADLEWNWSDGKALKLAGMKESDDWLKHAGRERDFIGFDEAGEFLVTQVASLMGWNRGPDGQRCRIVLASNPPRSADGLWMIQWFAPWLDRKFHDPAKPGELRWAVFVGGEPHWRSGKDDVMVMDGHEYKPLSLTFIPASLADNPFRNTPEYRARLNSLPEPLRSQLLYGDFSIGLKDSANQCIPTAWVSKAIARWTDTPPDDVPMCCIGVDASGGGDDPMIIAPRYDGWFAPLIEVPGKDIPQDRIGPFCAGQVISYRRDSAHVVIDMGGGYGGSTYDHLKHNDVGIHGFKGAEGTTKRTVDGQLKFTNKRSAAYWGFREALDPGQPGGSPIALPDDPKLLADLTAPSFEVTPNGIKVEPKEHVVKRLGRSPDRGDAVVMAWFEGPRETTAAMEWIERKERNRGGMRSMVIGGREPMTSRGRKQMTARS